MNELSIFQPSHPGRIEELGEWISGLPNAIFRSAKAMTDQEIANGAVLTEQEKQSVTIGNAIRITEGVDYGTHHIKWLLAKIARENGLAQIHPGHLNTLQEYLSEYGMSDTEYSNLTALFEYIFPWIADEYHNQDGSEMTPDQLWMQVGKTKLFELIPYMKVALGIGDILATGALSPSQATRLRDLETTVAASQMQMPHPNTLDEDLRGEAVTNIRNYINENWNAESRPRHLMSWLMNAGVNHTLTVSRLRDVLRPSGDHPMLSVIKKGTTKYLVMPLPDAEESKLRTRFRDYPIQDIDMDGDNAADQVRLVPILVSLKDLF